MSAYWMVTCDEPNCEETIAGHMSWRDNQAEAATRGWKLGAVHQPMYCFDHRPDKYSPCVVCNRPRRRRGWKKEDHPGTMAWGTKGRCVSCTAADNLGAGADTRLDNAVQQYLEKAKPGFAGVYEEHETGLTAHLVQARKVAPEDTWQTLGI